MLRLQRGKGKIIMKALRAILRTIDRINDWAGRLVSWVGAALIFAITYEVIARYVFVSPTIWSYDMAYMLGGTLIIIAGAYVLLRKEHLKVDIIYKRFPPKIRLISDLFFTLVFFLPLMVVLVNYSATWAWRAFIRHETSLVGVWAPPLWPFRTVIMIGVSLLLLQGVANFIKDMFLLVRGTKL